MHIFGHGNNRSLAVSTATRASQAVMIVLQSMSFSSPFTPTEQSKDAIEAAAKPSILCVAPLLGLDAVQVLLNSNEVPKLLPDREPHLFGDLAHGGWNGRVIGLRLAFEL